MKPEQIYQELKDLAEKLEVSVSEQNLRTTGIKAKSGLCKVKGQNLFIMDKHKSIHKKIEILASQLAKFPHEDLYVMPTIRELLEKRVTKNLKSSEISRAD
jgi:ABC-type enterochelin transport system substrate-binding protein